MRSSGRNRKCAFAIPLAFACFFCACSRPESEKRQKSPRALKSIGDTPDERFRESRFFREQDLFLPANDPKIISAAEASFLRDADEILGFLVGSRARAYSVRALAYHHVINDRIGSVPIAVPY